MPSPLEAADPKHMSQTGNSAPRRLRAAIVLLTLRHFDRTAEELEPSDVAWIAGTFRAEVEQIAKEQGGDTNVRGPGRIDLLFEASRSPSRAALCAVLTSVQLLARLRALETDAIQRGLRLPECSAAVHIDDFVSTGETNLLGSGMELALRMATLAHEGGVVISEATLDYIVAVLPPGWELVRGITEWTPIPEGTVDWMREDLLPLSDEFEGRLVRIGPGVTIDPDAAALEFVYWGEAVVPGRNRQFAMLRVNACGTSFAADEDHLQRKGRDLGSIVSASALPAPGAGEQSEPVRFGRYVLLQKLGEGGMGAVWLALDHFGNKVAIKQLLPGGSVSAAQLKRFQLEAEVMSRLSHRNIARIHEVGEVDGATFIAMEYVEGASLAEVLARSADEANDLATLVQTIHRERTLGRNESGGNPVSSPVGQVSRVGTTASRMQDRDAFVPPIPQSLALLQKICCAVHFAHERGVLHRDLKPHNIMIRPDSEPVIMDFGLAKLQRGDDERALSLSLSGQILGTVGYMAPEQAADSKYVTERADVYALGAILYEMLTGRRVFDTTGDLGADVARLREHVPTPPRKLNKLIERDLETITLKALRPEPEQRYTSARLFAEDLDRCAAGEPILARKPTFRYRLGKNIRKHRAAFVAASVILFLCAAFGIYAWTNYQKQWGKWVKIYEKDFAVPDVTLEDFEIRDILGIHPAVVASPESDGLPLETFSHYWLKDIRVAGSVRVVVEFTAADPSGNVGIFLNAAPGPLAGKTIDPRGYSAWINYSALDTISAQRHFAASNSFAAAVPTRLEAGRPQRMVFERDHEKLSLSLNGKTSMEWVELLPLQGSGFDRIGFRSWGDNVRLRSLTVYRLALPESSSPLAAGDALLEAGYPEDAIRRYRAIAEDFRGQPIAPLALAKGYLTAMEIQSMPGKRSANLQEIRESRQAIREQIERDYPGFGYRHLLMEADTLLDWRGNKEAQQRALAALPGILREKPESRIISRMLSSPGNAGVSELLPWVAKARSLTTLDLTWKDLENLDGLRGARLEALQVHKNPRLASIDSLRGMPLRAIEIDGHSLSDLEPLRGMPLESFRFGLGNVRDLSPLQGMPLKLLRLHNLKVDNFEPLRGLPLVRLTAEYMASLRNLDFLRGMPLRHLSLRSCPVNNLEPLRGLPLTKLAIESCNLADISPLADLALGSFSCRGTEVENLTPLKGMPLRNLDISRSRVTSLKTLAGLPLRRLTCHTNQIHSLEPLRGMPLDFLDCQNNPITSLEPFLDSPPADFHFASYTLPEAEYERAIAKWSTNPAWARNTRRAEIALALRRRDTDTLRRLAVILNGHRYLHVEQLFSWEKAREACERVGGHLLTLTSKEEADGVYNQGAGRGWLGINKPAGQRQWQWLTGEPYAFQEWVSTPGNADETTRAGSISGDSRQWYLETPGDGAIRSFTIEWDY